VLFWRIIFMLAAAGAELTDTTTETTLASTTLAAGQLAAGRAIEVIASTLTTSSNGTDTLTLKLYIGGTVVWTSAGVDQANNDVGTVRALASSKGTGAASTVDVTGYGVDPDATGTIAAKGFFKQLSLNTSSELEVKLTGTWSVQHADNKVKCHQFIVSAG
jgi:hypothetical protein